MGRYLWQALQGKRSSCSIAIPREDKELRDELEIHISALKRQYHLTSWYDRAILPGEDWEMAIDAHLSAAHIIILLISPHFMASDYCYGKEMGKALERHKARTCRVIPILLRPTYWDGAPFSDIQLLPTNARPVTSWPDRYEAFHDVVKEISRVIKDLLVSPQTKDEWIEEGNALYELKSYKEALAAYEKAIRLDPNNAEPYSSKGAILCELKRYREALAACEQAIHLDPNKASAYSNKGATLNGLKCYGEALLAFEQAIRLDPSLATAYTNKGAVLMNIMRK